MQTEETYLEYCVLQCVSNLIVGYIYFFWWKMPNILHFGLYICLKSSTLFPLCRVDVGRKLTAVNWSLCILNVVKLQHCLCKEKKPFVYHKLYIYIFVCLANVKSKHVFENCFRNLYIILGSIIEIRHVYSKKKKEACNKFVITIPYNKKHSRLIVVIFPLTARQEIWADNVDEN